MPFADFGYPGYDLNIFWLSWLCPSPILIILVMPLADFGYPGYALRRFWLSLLGPLVFLHNVLLHYGAFQSFDTELT